MRVSVEPVDDEKPLWVKDLLPRILVNEGESVALTSQVYFFLMLKILLLLTMKTCKILLCF